MFSIQNNFKFFYSQYLSLFYQRRIIVVLNSVKKIIHNNIYIVSIIIPNLTFILRWLISIRCQRFVTMCAFEIHHLSRHNSNNQSWRPRLFDASVDFASMRRRPSRRGAHSICDSDVLVYTANRARLSSTMRRWTVDRRHWSPNGMATIVSPLALVILQRERIPLFDFET